MSKLKDYTATDIEAMYDERLEKSKSGKIKVTRVYIRSEADREIRKQKRKRCLAMKEYCASELEIAFRNTCISESVRGCTFFRRWLNKWLELADKFKEAK